LARCGLFKFGQLIKSPSYLPYINWSFLEENVSILAHYTGPITNRTRKKRKNTKKSKTPIHLARALRVSFVTAAETASRLSSDARAKLHKMEVAEEGLLLGKSAEYTASQVHRPTPTPTPPHSIPPPTTRAQLGFPPYIIFLEIKRVDNNIT
jgi:hypothetical protein